MWKENLYQPVEILIRNHEIFPIAEHQHSFFEMVYVHEGTGRFYVKESDCKVEEVIYHAHSLFLIPPETPHCFTIDTHSEYNRYGTVPQMMWTVPWHKTRHP